MSYGTGAIMAVPAHDDRDWEFAKKFGLPDHRGRQAAAMCRRRRSPHCDETGIMVNSGFLDGMTVEEAKKAMTEWLGEKGIGHAKVNYKLRDWVFSRQRYWGEPIPIVNCEQVRLRSAAGESSFRCELPNVRHLRADRQRRVPARAR